MKISCNITGSASRPPKRCGQVRATGGVGSRSPVVPTGPRTCRQVIGSNGLLSAQANSLGVATRPCTRRQVITRQPAACGPRTRRQVAADKDTALQSLSDSKNNEDDEISDSGLYLIH